MLTCVLKIHVQNFTDRNVVSNVEGNLGEDFLGKNFINGTSYSIGMGKFHHLSQAVTSG